MKKETCPENVRRTLLGQAKEVFWRRWARHHEIEELEEGAWFESIKAVLKRTPNGIWMARQAA